MKRKLTLREAKYKKTVEAVYGENGPNTHNIQSLQQYALMTPGKLPKIGKYVFNKAKEGLKDKKRGVCTVTTSMTIFNELIKTCHGDLALFAAPVCEMMTILLASPIIDLKASGTETFIRFAEHGGIQYELEKYVQYFIDMSSRTIAGNPQEEKQMRMYGLRGLHAYIIMTEDLDNLIARFVDVHHETAQTNLLPIFLDNMQYTGDKKQEKQENNEKDSADSIPKIATLCLKDMAARVNHITVRPLCESLLEYLDSRKLWEPNHFAIEALKSLSIGVLPQLYSTIIRFLLEHLDKQPAGNWTEKKNMVQCVQQVMPQSITQQMPEVLSCMINQIVSQGEEGSELADAAVSCIAYIIDKQTDPLHQFDAISEILAHIYASPITSKSKISLCDAVLSSTETLKALPDDKKYPPSVIERLCVACLDKEASVREQLLVCLIRILKQTDLLKRMGNNGKPSVNVMQHQHEIYLTQIHSSLLSQALRMNNTPLHYRLIFEVHSLLLESLQCTGIVSLLPNLFHLQDPTEEKQQTAEVQTLVAALLSKVSDVANIQSLAQYVAEIITKRKEASQISNSLSVALDKCELHVHDSTCINDDTQVDILFEKEKIIEFLSHNQELSTKHDLPSLLDKSVSRSVTIKPVLNEAKIEERRKRKVNAISVSSTAVRTSIPALDISIPEWSAQTFDLIFETERSISNPPVQMHSYKDVVPLIEKKNNACALGLANAFEFLELECAVPDGVVSSSLLDFTFPSLAQFIQSPESVAE